MRRANLAMVLTSILICFTAVSAASENDYRQAMDAALNLHGGGTFKSEQAAAQAFIDVAEQHPDEWLPYYWASYIYTQLANFHGRLSGTPEDVTRDQLVEAAQGYLDKAARRVKTGTPEISSDLGILQHFIHTLRVRFAEEEAAKKSHQEAAEAELHKAVAANPNNPLIYTLVATDIANKSRDDVRGLLAARVLLESAREQFNAASQPRSLTSAWNQEWIEFWLERIASQLIKVAEGRQ